MAAMRLLPWLVTAALLCACPAAHALDAGSMSADELAKVLAGVTFIKELGNVDNAKHAMNLFSHVADKHIGQVAGGKGSSFQDTTSGQQTTDNANPFNSIFNHGDPKFEYFLDPEQNPAADFFGFLKPENTYVGSVSGPNAITYAPCFAAVAPSGVNIAATLINYIPGLLSITPSGVGIAPQGVNIQPSIIYISPYGVNAAPQGFNIQPQLIAVTPIEYSVIPQGYNYAPALISVAGRKMLQVDGAAAARKLLGSVNVAGAQKHKLISADDQAKVFTESYGNWVDTVSALILGRAGGSPDNAKSFLTQTMNRTDHYLSLLNNDMLGSLSKFLPQPPSFSAPTFFQDASANISSTTNGFVLFSSIINYAPCAVQIAPAGVSISASGININPVGIAVTPQGVNVQPQGLNIQPTLIFIAPIGRSDTPQGGNISPTLIAISPVGESINPQGYSCAASLISIDEDGKVEFNDDGGCNGEEEGGDSDGEGATQTAAATGR